jgi:hypothetical protein
LGSTKRLHYNTVKSLFQAWISESVRFHCEEFELVASTVVIEGSHIAFTGGMFRLITNWNVLVPFGYGDLTVDAI